MANWASRLRRLRSMERGEIASRMRQFVTARADELRCRAGHNFADISQITDVCPSGRFFFGAGEASALCALVQRTVPAQAAAIVTQAHKLCEHRFDLLGYSDLDYGNEIDWHLDVVHGKRGPRRPWFKIKYLDFEAVGDSKITWELNRHQHFLTLAKAYWLTGNEQFVREIFAQWEHWQRENPYSIGMNWASSLEVAFRSLSWIWTFFLLEDCALFSSDLRRRWLAMLNLSGRHIETYLSTYFSPNTHLLGEALALFFLGTLFRLPSASRWQERGWDVLVKESGRQVRADGFYFEQSTYYHVYALDMLLHARVLAGLNQAGLNQGLNQNGSNQAGLNKIAISDEFERNLQRMLRTLALLSRAGVPPMFGDDDGGRLFDARRNRAEHMLDPLATGAVVYGREEFKVTATPGGETIWLLGAKGVADFELLASRPSSDSVALAASGFYLMADGDCRQQLVMDAGPLGAESGGHGHADALSVWLVRNGENLLRDSGTFEYVGESGERSRLRSTGAHNTLRVDGRDQAKSTGPFSWDSFPAVQVRRWITGQRFDLLEAEHDGYSRSSSPVTHAPVTHRRHVFHRKGHFWLVRDVAEGSGSHQLELAWHIGAGLSQASADGEFFIGEGKSLALLTPTGDAWSHKVRSEKWSPVYGSSETAQVVRFASVQNLPAEFVTLFIAGTVEEEIGRLVRVDQGVGASAYRYLLSEGRQQESHNFVFAGETGAWTQGSSTQGSSTQGSSTRGSWTQGSWTSDADFLYSHYDRDGRLRLLVLCNGTYADFEGERIISCDRLVSYAEVWRVNDPRSNDPHSDGRHSDGLHSDGQWELAGSDASHVSLGAAMQGSLA